jgi:hypothetical protein
MIKLFETAADLSGYLFRITDNGGATADRFTIMFSDGDYYGASANPYSPQGVGMWGEGFDPQIPEDNTQAGTERDLRWIDLPLVVRECVLNSLNQGMADYLATDGADVPTSRDAVEFDDRKPKVGQGLYKTAAGFMIAREWEDESDDLGPYETFRDAVRNTLPEPYDLSGPEYHGPAGYEEGLTGEEGLTPRPLWDCEEEPPETETED